MTTFDDADLRRIVDETYTRAEEADAIFAALVQRRDGIGLRYLRSYAATEAPEITERGLCFEDIALARGYLSEAAVSYEVEWIDVAGQSLKRTVVPAAGPRTCLPLPKQPPNYLVAAVRTRMGAHLSRPTYLHVGRSDGASFRVRGIDRDET